MNRRVWPNATIYSCWNHVARICEKKLAQDGHAQFSDLWWKLQRGVKDEAAWQVFDHEARAQAATATLRWIGSKRQMMKRQFAI